MADAAAWPRRQSVVIALQVLQVAAAILEALLVPGLFLWKGLIGDNLLETLVLAAIGAALGMLVSSTP